MALVSGSTTSSLRVGLLEVIEQAELTGKQTPPAWNGGVAAQLASADAAVVRQAIAAAKVLGPETFREPLKKIVQERRDKGELSLVALKALGPAAGEPDDGTFAMLFTRLTCSPDPLEKLEAASILGTLPLTAEQRGRLLESVKTVGPLELPALLAVFEREGTTEEGLKLVAGLGQAPGFANLTVGALQKSLARYPPEVRAAAEPLVQRLNADIAAQRSRLAELEAQLNGGDVTRGKNLFTVKKTSCIACHTVKSQGGRIGPDLSNVGQIRSRTDILESILFPSASFVRGFESVTVTTADGLEVTGILSRETPDAVYLKTAQREEIRVPRKDVEEIMPSKLSIMPTGLDKVLTTAELRDIVAYLQSLK
ncbi:MAG: c-type cytochrome [Pirellulales bacterium]